jgi:hypothetical protein
MSIGKWRPMMVRANPDYFVMDWVPEAGPPNTRWRGDDRKGISSRPGSEMESNAKRYR